MILAPSRQLICPRCRKPLPAARQTRLRSARNDPRDRFRPSLMNMATADTLLSGSAKRLLRPDGTKALDNGLTNDCCCGSGSGGCTCPSNILLTFSGFNGEGVCGFISSATFQFDGSLDGLSICVPGPSPFPDCSYDATVTTGLTITSYCEPSICPSQSGSQLVVSFGLTGFGWGISMILRSPTGPIAGCVSDAIGLFFKSGGSGDAVLPADCTSHTVSVPAVMTNLGTPFEVLSAGSFTFTPGGC